MKRPFTVHSASNMPIQAPVFEDPNVPYDCPDLKSLCVYARTSPDIVKKYFALVNKKWTREIEKWNEQ